MFILLVTGTALSQTLEKTCAECFNNIRRERDRDREIERRRRKGYYYSIQTAVKLLLYIQL